ncbi:hypothetical protein KY359_04120, partial [Candidatus Woesearchaeota archaeon]|nr:hypothetical protein [Candidatus Woesearchaeota archaeon]
MASSRRRKDTAKLEDVVDVLSAYASAVADKDIAIIGGRSGYSGLTEGCYIALPFNVIDEREKLLSDLKVRVTLEASILRCADDPIDPSALPRAWRSRLGDEAARLTEFSLHGIVSHSYWAGFTTLMKIFELGRVRQHVRSEYPMLDGDIDTFVRRELFLADRRRHLRQDLCDWPEALLSELSGPGRQKNSIQTYEERENELTCRELVYILLLSGDAVVSKERAELTEKSRRIYDLVFPVLSQPGATKSDSVRLAIEVMDSEFREGRHDTRQKDDVEKMVEQERKKNPDYFPESALHLSGISDSIRNISRKMSFSDRKEKEEEREPPLMRFKVDEWDSTSRSYIREACIVTELNINPYPGTDKVIPPRCGFSETEVAEIRDVLEALKPEGKVTSRKLRSGELDFDQWVKYMMQKSAGTNPEERFYKRSERRERDVAQLILWDISGSTLGYCSKTALKEGMRIIDMEAYGLIHYAAALKELGDDLAIFAYNSLGRDKVAVYPIMRFGSGMDVSELMSVMKDIRPQHNNHDGAALRHVLHNYLAHHSARTRILVHINDGVPEDKTKSHYNLAAHVFRSKELAEYRGNYAVEDVKRALSEYASQGIITFGISFAREKTRPALEAIWGDQYKMLKT